MQFRSETVEMGVVERPFTLDTAEGPVPGIHWSPEAADGPRPTVLIGHGGTQHKRAANVLALARRFVRHLGFSAVALDAPDHGDRVVDREAAERHRRALQERLAAGVPAGTRSGPRTFDPRETAQWIERTRRGVLEWKTLLDALDKLDAGAATTTAGTTANTAGATTTTGAAATTLSSGRYGYWGLSMGTAIGLPLVASEPRIAAAVLGLAGLATRPGAEEFERMARRLETPVLLVEQWDDELVARDAALALFDAIGSKDKTLHVFLGGHIATPAHERDAYDAFFARHLKG